MSATLHFKRGPEEREIPCAALLTIGRMPPNEIVIPHPKISRNHALIRRAGQGEYYLIDVGSTNGTLLNGRRVVTPMSLKDGDTIKLEDCTLVFRAANVPQPPPPSEDDEDSQVTVTMTSMGIQLEEITLLVCDVRGYTRLSEKLPPNELASLMARWFKSATKAIEGCGGTIDKFIGDAVMVRWASDGGRKVRGSVLNALETARRLHQISATINETVANLPQPFRIGVGINTGRAVLGSIGGSGYREYTAIGDAVNMAFRFEASSKELGRDVVLGPESYAHLPQALWQEACRSITVKGKSEPVSVWALAFAELDEVLAAAKT